MPTSMRRRSTDPWSVAWAVVLAIVVTSPGRLCLGESLGFLWGIDGSLAPTAQPAAQPAPRETGLDQGFVGPGWRRGARSEARPALEGTRPRIRQHGAIKAGVLQ